MQVAQENQNLPIKVKNTFSTDSSKRENQIENDDHFKEQRKKYLQERLNRRKQVKQIRKEKFGSSSSESEKSLQKPKLTIVNDFSAMRAPTIQEKEKKKSQQQQFHQKHQAYIKQKMARKQQLIAQRRKQFGNSSSDSDDDLQLKIQCPQKAIQVREYIDGSLQGDKSFKKPTQMKRSLGSTNSDKNSHPVIVQQIVYTKCEKVSDSKKLTILVQSKKNMQWIEQTLVIQNKRIKLLNQNIQLLISHVSKIKLFFTGVTNREYLKMKITIKNDQDYLFGVSCKMMIDNLPQYYYLFARIVQEKLIQIGFEPRKNQHSVMPNYHNIKDVPLYLKTNAIVFGNILKKSQYLGNWERRFVYIAEKEIGSGKRPMDKPSMVIETSSISELWTRFDIESDNMLTIKVMYNSNTKTEFAIPISGYTDQYNWLYSFFRVIRQC